MAPQMAATVFRCALILKRQNRCHNDPLSKCFQRKLQHVLKAALRNILNIATVLETHQTSCAELDSACYTEQIEN